MWVAFAFEKTATPIFQQKNTREWDIVLSRTVNILTANELVKFTKLWTTEHWYDCMAKSESVQIAHT